MKTVTPIALGLLLMALAACSNSDSNTQPRQISKDRAGSGIPPLTGTLPNGVIGDSATK